MREQIEFATEDTAEMALTLCGFSIGTLQRNDPRGVMFGDYEIMKWRNLSSKDKGDLHAVYADGSSDWPELVVECGHEEGWFKEWSNHHEQPDWDANYPDPSDCNVVSRRCFTLYNEAKAQEVAA